MFVGFAAVADCNVCLSLIHIFVVNGEVIGSFGEVHPVVQENFELDQVTYVLEMAVEPCKVTERKYSKTVAFEDINYQLAQADDNN